MSEPSIIINSHRLTEAQAMAVRVAINSFAMEMEQPGALGDDDAGKELASAYCARLYEVIRIIHKRGP